MNRIYRLPLHYYAEQLERIWVNRKQFPTCGAFQNEETYYIKHLFNEVRENQREIREILTNKYSASYQNGGVGHLAPRKGW